MGCAPVGDEGRHRPIEPIADEKDKGGRPVHNARTERFARDFEFVKPIVAGSGLSANWENSAAGQPNPAPKPSTASVLHHSDHLLPHQFGDQRRQHSLASSGLAGQEGLKRRACAKCSCSVRTTGLRTPWFTRMPAGLASACGVSPETLIAVA